jgi:hypothetical protein
MIFSARKYFYACSANIILWGIIPEQTVRMPNDGLIK